MVIFDTRFGRRGFTLIEILVAMSIVAMLLTLALPRYFNSLAKARDVALQENLKVMRLSIEKYRADKGLYPETLDELVKDGYLRVVPVDPVLESSKDWQLIPSGDPESPGVADVRSSAPGESRDGRKYDQF